MATKDARIDSYIAKSADFAKPILTHIRRLVHAACPDVEETMKWSLPYFMYKGMLCNMAAFKSQGSGGISDDPLHHGFDRATRVPILQGGLLGSGTLQPGKELNSIEAQELRQQPRIAATGRIRLARSHQDHLRLFGRPAGQGSRHEQRLIDCAEPVWADNNRNGPQRSNQVPGVEILPQRTQQSPGPFHDDN